MIQRPLPHEYATFYKTYIDKVPEEEEVFNILIAQLQETIDIFKQIDTEKAAFRYAPGKWSVAELFQHIIDTERVMAYRALRIARNDKTPMPGFDQDDFAAAVDMTDRPPESIRDEFLSLRTANLLFFRYLSEEATKQIGNASGADISVRALAYILAGHFIHHIGVLKERYLL